MATNSVTLHFQLLIKATPIGICVIRNVTLIPPPTSIECQSLIWPTLTCAGDGCSLTIVNEILNKPTGQRKSDFKIGIISFNLKQHNSELLVANI